MVLRTGHVVGTLSRAKAGQEVCSSAHKFLGPTNVMLRRSALLLMLGSLAGCAGDLGQTFMVHFMPLSPAPDTQGQGTLQAAIAFAKSNTLRAVTIDGFHYGQYPNQFDSLSEDRVRVVVSRLVEAGIGRERIDILGKGIAYAQGSPMPNLPPDTVKIAIGL